VTADRFDLLAAVAAADRAARAERRRSELGRALCVLAMLLRPLDTRNGSDVTSAAGSPVQS
jgi:hypothetical protein